MGGHGAAGAREVLEEQGDGMSMIMIRHDT